MNSFSNTYLSNYVEILDEIIYDINKFLISSAHKEKFYNDYDLKNINHFDFLDILSNTKKFYKKIEIHTTKKTRIVYEPSHKLYLIQKFILYNYLINKDSLLSSNLTSYRKKYSIKDNVNNHLNKKIIIKMDIQNFFPTINRYRIYKYLLKMNIEEKKAYLFSRLLTYNSQLIQGTPSSPFISNLLSSKLDRRIEGYIKIYKKSKIEISYSRYSDDMTFSMNQKINLTKFVNFIYKIILDEGFIPNYNKTQIISSNKKQRVTGIIVNKEKMSISKKERDDLLFIINLWIKYDVKTAMDKYNQIYKKAYTEDRDFHQIIKSKIFYIRFINKEQSKKLEEKFRILEKKLNI